MSSPSLPQQNHTFDQQSFGQQAQQFGVVQQTQPGFSTPGFGLNGSNSMGFSSAGFNAQAQPLGQNQPPHPPSFNHNGSLSQQGGFAHNQSGNNFFSPPPSGPSSGVFARQENGGALSGVNSSNHTNGFTTNTASGPFGQSNLLTNEPAIATNGAQGGVSTTNPGHLNGVNATHVSDACGDNSDLRAAYQHLAQTGQFRDGIMPETAPQTGWVRF